MSKEIIIAIIAAIPPTLVAMLALLKAGKVETGRQWQGFTDTGIK